MGIKLEIYIYYQVIQEFKQYYVVWEYWDIMRCTTSIWCV